MKRLLKNRGMANNKIVRILLAIRTLKLQAAGDGVRWAVK